jgi:aryl-alcohol dehydrogenase-like predicted oxidoreductase
MTATPTGAGRLGIGLAAVGRPAYITPGRAADLGEDRAPDHLERRTHALLDAAVTAGVRYVDVARSYGRAEEFVASWLATRDVPDVEVGSKWGYRYVGDWRRDAAVHEVKDHSIGAFLEQWPLTARHLGARLGRYLIHSATLDTGALTDRALHRELARVRDKGIRVGISTSGPQQGDAVRTALDVVVGGAPLFTAFQVTWNPLEPSVGPAAAEAADRGAQVVVKEVVANGRLAPGTDDDAPGVRHVVGLAGEVGVPVDQLCVAVALAQPWVWRVLSGAATTEHLASHVTGSGLVLGADVVAEAVRAAEEPKAYWAARSARAWS